MILQLFIREFCKSEKTCHNGRKIYLTTFDFKNMIKQISNIIFLFIFFEKIVF